MIMGREFNRFSRTAKYVNVSHSSTDDPVVLCYEAFGDGAPILCVPGLGDTNWVWRKLIPTLMHLHRVIALEPRGHGRSSSPRGKYTLDEMAGDIQNVIALLSLEKPIIIGHGLGARAALLFAIEQPRHPAALVLIATGAAPASKSVRRGIAERIHLAEAGEMREAYKNRKNENREPRGMNPRERAQHHRLFLQNNPSGYASAGYAELLAPDLLDRLGEVSCPVLALTGEHDGEYHPDIQMLSTKISRCESVLIEGTSRYVQLDKAEATLALIHDFLRKHHLVVANSTEEDDEPTH